MELCKKSTVVLLPYLEKNGRCWCLIELRRSSASAVDQVRVHHWYMQKRESVRDLENKLAQLFPQVTVSKQVYEFEGKASNMLCMHLCQRIFVNPFEQIELSMELLSSLHAQHLKIRDFLDQLTEAIVLNQSTLHEALTDVPGISEFLQECQAFFTIPHA